MNDISIVNTNSNYTYANLENDIESLKSKFPFLECGTIGKSVLDKNLYYLKLGLGKNKVFLNGAHHSLEWITSLLLMKFIEDFCINYSSATSLLDYDLINIWNTSTIYIVPMVNPDGVDLVLNGLDAINEHNKDELIEWNNNSNDFSNTWQANIRGVDLNHNYNASWDKYKLCEIENDIKGPNYTRYAGEHPESEPESKSVANFTRDHCFDLSLALHSQGKEIYWDYNNMATDFSKRIGKDLAKVSGYVLTSPKGVASYTGYKDWFIEKFQKPGFTIEVGRGTNPLPVSQFNEIYTDILELLLIACVSTDNNFYP